MAQTDIQKNLIPDEQIVFYTRKHLILCAWPIIISLFCLLAGKYMVTQPILERIIWIPILVAAVVWIKFFLEYYFSEFAVTNKRVWMREGFFIRHTNETRLTAIAKINVDQTLIGQLFNYGTISIQSFGASSDVFTLVASPYRLQYFVNQATDALPKKNS